MAYFTHEIAVEFNEWKLVDSRNEGTWGTFTATKTLKLEREPPSGWEPIVLLEVAKECQGMQKRDISYRYVSSKELDISIQIVKADTAEFVSSILERRQIWSYPGKIVLRVLLGFNPTGDVAKEKRLLEQKVETAIDELKAMKAMHAELIDMVTKHLMKQ